MATVTYCITIVCLIYGYKCSSSNNTTPLVLRDHACDENNDTTVRYEPITFREIYELEDEILGLVSDGEKVMFSEYGETVRFETDGCFKLIEPVENDTGINEIKEIIRLTSEQLTQPFKHCIRHVTHYAGLIATTCGCIPISLWIKQEYFEKANIVHCLTYDSKTIANHSSDVYMFIFEQDLIYRDDFFFQEISSCNILTNYIRVNKEEGVLDTTYLASHCGVATDGHLCFNRSKNILNAFLKENATKYSNRTCLDKNLIECSDMHLESNLDEYVHFHLDHINNVLLSYYLSTITFLYTLEKQKNVKCVTLFRYADRLFVITNFCIYYTKIKYICKQITYSNKGTIIDIANADNKLTTDKQQLLLTLIATLVSILLVSTIVTVVLVKRRRYQNTSSQRSASPDNINDIELHSIGSTDGGGVIGHDQDDGDDTGHTADDGAVSVSSISDQTAAGDGGAVPGRIGWLQESDDTDGGEVPGRTPWGYNFYYATNVNSEQ